MGAHHELRNRYLHVDWPQDEATQETTQETRQTTQETVSSTKSRILSLLKDRPEITARELSQELGITFDGVRYHLTKLRKEGLIHHAGATKSGRWIVHE